MHYTLKISLRYLFAKKSANIINVISAISMGGILVGAAALLIVLSVFNGLHGLIGSLFGTFDPQLKIEASDGRTFACGDSLMRAVNSTSGVAAAYRALEDNALIKFGERQMPATVLGVDNMFANVTGIDSITYDGRFSIQNEPLSNVGSHSGKIAEAASDGTPDTAAITDGAERSAQRRPFKCAMGFVLAGQLGASPGQFHNNLVIYAPKRTGQINMASPERSFIKQNTQLTGVFCVNQMEYDEKYAIVGLSQARELFCLGANEVSHIGVRCEQNANPEDVKRLLQKALGEAYSVKDQTEQHETFFRMMRIEKFMAYLILTFILAIAAFNIIGSLSMLIFEKKESVFTLKAMGASQGAVTRVFLAEGLMISVGGAILGLALGIALTLLQERFGLIGFGNEGAYIVSAYPVRLDWADVLAVFATVIAVGYAAAWYPVKRGVAKYY